MPAVWSHGGCCFKLYEYILNEIWRDSSKLQESICWLTQKYWTDNVTSFHMCLMPGRDGPLSGLEYGKEIKRDKPVYLHETDRTSVHNSVINAVLSLLLFLYKYTNLTSQITTVIAHTSLWCANSQGVIERMILCLWLPFHLIAWWEEEWWHFGVHNYMSLLWSV